MRGVTNFYLRVTSGIINLNWGGKKKHVIKVIRNSKFNVDRETARNCHENIYARHVLIYINPRSGNHDVRWVRKIEFLSR